MSDYIGKGEKATSKILSRLFHVENTYSQVPLLALVPNMPDTLGPEYKKHKCDIVVPTNPPIVCEVNLKHGTKAHEKWKIYKDILEYGMYQTVTIDDYDTRHIFESDEDNLTWDDFRDIIDALEKAGIKP